MLKFSTAILLACSFVGTPVLASVKVGTAEMPVQAAPPLHPALTQGVLGNGMRFLLLPNASPAARLNLWLIVNAGSLDEDDDQRGVAHLVEHMLFRSTARYPHSGLVRRFEQLGLKFGRDVNAFTEYRRTVYQVSLPSDDPARLDEVLGILREWAAFATIDATELDGERGVVIEEWRKSQDAGRRLAQQRREASLAGSRHLVREPIGDPQTVRTVSRERVRDFYRRWYQPANMTVAVGGDFKVEPMRRRIEARFAGLPSQPPPPRRHAALAVYDTTRHLHLSDAEATERSIELSYRRARPDPSSAVGWRGALQQQVLVALFNRRASAALDDGGHPAVAAMGASAATLADEMSSVGFGVRLRDGRFEDGARVLLTELERVDRHGFREDELSRVRTELLSEWERAAADADKLPTARLMQGLLGWQRNGEPFMSPAQRLEWGRAALAGLDLASLNQAWRTLRAGRDRLVVQQDVGGETRRVVDEAQWSALENRVARLDLPALAAPRAVDLPPPALPAGRIVAERPGSAPGSLEWTLGNGARVLYLPSSNSRTRVLLSASSPRGRLAADPADYHALGVAGQLLGNAGLAGFSRVELQRWQAARRVELASRLGETEFTSQLGADVETLEPAFRLLHVQFTMPSGDARDWQKLSAALADGIRLRGKSPADAFGLAVAQAGYADERAAPLSAGELARLDLPRLQALAGTLFANAADYTFVVSGPVGATDLKPLVERYLASLPGRPADKPAYQPLVRRADAPTVRVAAGREPVAEVLLRFDREDSAVDAADALALRAFSDVLGGNLRRQLREQAAGVYAVQASFGVSPPLGRMGGSVRFTCDPQRADDLRALAQQEVAKLLEHGIDQTALDEFRRQEGKRLEEAGERDSEQVGRVLTSYQWLGDDSLPARQRDWLAGLTPATVNATARRLLGRAARLDAVRLPAAGVKS